jgi:hypothetical protein
VSKGPRRVPEDRAATREEIEAAFAHLSETELLRLELYAIRRVAGLPSRDRDHEDLKETAITEALTGTRRWDPAKVDFFGFLMGAMRSISDHWYEKKGVGHAIVVEASMRRVSDEGEEEQSPLDRFAAPAPDAEDALVAAEEEAEAKRRVEQIADALSGDAVALEIIDGLCSGMTRDEVREAMDLPQKEWEASWKRIRRKTRGVAIGGVSDA